MDLSFETEMWKWDGQAAWYFVSLPKEYYQDIKTISSTPRRGFGSVKVEVKIGNTKWKTSIFPDASTSTYLLPIKKDVRKSENLDIGTKIYIKVRLINT